MQHHSMAVRSSSNHLYRAFAAEIQELGWIFHSTFGFSSKTQGSFVPDRVEYGSKACLYLSNGEWSGSEHPPGTPLFATSSTDDAKYDLDINYSGAVRQAGELLQLIKAQAEVHFKLNSAYTAIITKDKVKVGCQDFTHGTILNLASAINTFNSKQ